MIYLDNAATTKVREEVILEMSRVLEVSYGNPSGQYRIAREAKYLLDSSRQTIASLINADMPSEVYFTSGGTESDDWAIIGAALANSGRGHHIITSSYEHHAVLETMKMLEKNGFSVTYIDPERDGTISPSKVAAAVRKDTVLISVMYVNNEIGSVNDIERISSVAKDNGILMHTDAVQAAGHIPVDVKELGIDLLSASAHKFYGPKGIGLLYVRNGILLRQLHFGGSQERGRRPGTENVSAVCGMSKALELACREMDMEYSRLAVLKQKLADGIRSISADAVFNPGDGPCVPYILNVSFGIPSAVVLARLDMKDIAVSAGAACSAGTAGSSHVIRVLGADKDVIDSAIRFSLGRYNTDEDIDGALCALKEVLG